METRRLHQVWRGHAQADAPPKRRCGPGRLRILVLPATVALIASAATPASVGAATAILTVSSDTTLTADQNGGIVIAADNVILDGGGYTLHYDGSSCTGVTVSGRTGVTIRNLTVVGFTCGGGFLLGGSSATPTTGNTLTDDTASGNGAGFVLDRATGNTLVGNHADHNSANGFQIKTGSSGNTISANVANGNGDSGIRISESNHVVVTDNTTASNVDFGIVLDDSSDGLVVGNTLSANNVGIQVDSGSTANRVVGNTSTGGILGFCVVTASANTFTDNTATGAKNADGNGGGFALFFSATDNTFERNVTTGNDFGFIINNASNRNTFRQNTALGNSRFGFSLCSGTANTFVKNTATDNDFGFAINNASSHNTFRQNTASANSRFGFSLYVGSTQNQLIDNQANGNGQFGFALQAGSKANELRGNQACRSGIVDLKESADSAPNVYADNTFCTTDRVTTLPKATPVTSGSWTATLSGAGISGTASLVVPATGWATAAFSLSRLKKGVSVSARIVAGAVCDASATTVVRLPGYTTTIGGTWYQRWVFDGAALDRLRSAIGSDTPLWFDASVGGDRACTRLAPVT